MHAASCHCEPFSKPSKEKARQSIHLDCRYVEEDADDERRQKPQPGQEIDDCADVDELVGDQQSHALCMGYGSKNKWLD